MAMGSYSKNDVLRPLWRRSEATQASVRRHPHFVPRSQTKRGFERKWRMGLTLTDRPAFGKRR